MIIVDNCTLSALHKINKLDILSCLFKKILIPVAVQNEFCWGWKEILDNESFELAQMTPQSSNLVVETGKFRNLGRGEQECILWGLQTNLPVATDDLEVRKLCKTLGITIIGTLGRCRLAYQKGCYKTRDQYLEAINNLQKDLYLSQELVQWALDV